MRNINECKVYDMPDVNMQNVGRYLKELRIKNNIKISQLQEFFGFDYPQAIYNWEKRTKLPCISNLIALAKLYDVTVDSILNCAA